VDAPVDVDAGEVLGAAEDFAEIHEGRDLPDPFPRHFRPI
jgi:hypothetical protein